MPSFHLYYFHTSVITAQATSEECDDSYLEVARPRRSHHHWENRFKLLKITSILFLIDQFRKKSDCSDHDHRKSLLDPTSSPPCLPTTATGTCSGGGQPPPQFQKVFALLDLVHAPPDCPILLLPVAAACPCSSSSSASSLLFQFSCLRPQLASSPGSRLD